MALIDCLNVTVTASLAIAAAYVSSTSGLLDAVTGANTDVGFAALVARACSGLARGRSPLTR